MFWQVKTYFRVSPRLAGRSARGGRENARMLRHGRRDGLAGDQASSDELVGVGRCGWGAAGADGARRFPHGGRGPRRAGPGSRSTRGLIRVRPRWRGSRARGGCHETGQVEGGTGYARSRELRGQDVLRSG
jgi:hypothetical protein